MTRAPSITRTALALLPLQAVFRGGEAVLPLLLAAWFGRSEATDLYFFLAAYFVFAAALLTAAFQDSAAVPVLIEIEYKAPETFAAVAGSLLGHTLAIGAALTVVLGGVAAGVTAALSRLPLLALELVALMALALLATALRAFWVGLLNARGVFKAHPVASGVGMALTIAILYALRGALGVRAIPLAMIVGELTSVVILSAIARRWLGLRLTPNLSRPEPVKRIFALVRLDAMGQIITRINPVVDQAMVGLAGVVGGGTILRYAGDVASLPTSILQATVLPVLLTRLAQEASERAAFRSTVERTLAVTTALLVLLSLAFFAVRVPLCELLFRHGAMDDAGARGIADVLPYSLLGVAPFGALLVLVRAHVAKQNSRIMPSMGVLNASLNALLNLVFVRTLGVAGIALSTSVMYAIVALVFWVRLRKVS